MSKILIVDDDSSIRSALTALFKKRGHDVHSAQNGSEAIRIIDYFKPDLIILDYKMPILDGLGVLKVLSTMPDPPAVLMLTGHGDAATAHEAFNYGAYDYLNKPCDIYHLQKNVENKLNSIRPLQ